MLNFKYNDMLMCALQRVKECVLSMIIYRLPASRNKVMSKRSCTSRESNISVRKFRNITRCKCNRFGVLFGSLSSKLIQYVTFTYISDRCRVQANN